MGKIVNWGSLNLDKIYTVPHTPLPGETLASTSYRIGAGGKGLNQSVAAARAGAAVCHAGAVGSDGALLTDILQDAGVDISLVHRHAGRESGHAVILVNAAGNNSIILAPGTNVSLTEAELDEAVACAGEGGCLLLQNETNLVGEAMRAARRAGVLCAFNFAPFDPQAAATLPLECVDILFVNEIEGGCLAGLPQGAPEEITAALHRRYPDMLLVMTLGGDGVRCVTPQGEVQTLVPPLVKVVDTTAAGDTFTGYFLAEYLASHDVRIALELATAAASLCVTRSGAAPSIPCRAELVSDVD